MKCDNVVEYLSNTELQVFHFHIHIYSTDIIRSITKPNLSKSLLLFASRRGQRVIAQWQGSRNDTPSRHRFNSLSRQSMLKLQKYFFYSLPGFQANVFTFMNDPSPHSCVGFLSVWHLRKIYVKLSQSSYSRRHKDVENSQ